MSETAFAAALADPAAPAPPGYGGAEAARRFAVHRNNVVSGLVDGLAGTYPAVLALVGESFFRAAARDFARACPPRSPVLIDYGGGFAAFLAAFRPAASLPYLPDVARLEWARTRVYHAAEATPAPLALLGSVPPETLAGRRLAAHPALRLVRSRWPAATLWAETTGRAARTLRGLDRAETALVLRPDAAVTVDVLTPGEDAFLAALLDGAVIGAAAEAGAAHSGFDLGAAFRRLFGAGAFAGFAPSSDGDAP